MRCPRCLDEYEPHVRTCADCGLELVEDPTDATVPVAVDARLGTFHPAVAARLATLLDGRAIRHVEEPTESGVRILVDPAWRDDLRAELTLTWTELVHRLPEEQVLEVLASGGAAPGWYDAPRGGYVDRQGRLVVADDEELLEEDAARVVGPALLTVGAILAVIGWYVLDSSAVTVAAAGLVLLGLLTPR